MLMEDKELNLSAASCRDIKVIWYISNSTLKLTAVPSKEARVTRACLLESLTAAALFSVLTLIFGLPLNTAMCMSIKREWHKSMCDSSNISTQKKKRSKKKKRFNLSSKDTSTALWHARFKPLIFCLILITTVLQG